jgi:hypothetical protein
MIEQAASGADYSQGLKISRSRHILQRGSCLHVLHDSKLRQYQFGRRSDTNRERG